MQVKTQLLICLYMCIFTIIGMKYYVANLIIECLFYSFCISEKHLCVWSLMKCFHQSKYIKLFQQTSEPSDNNMNVSFIYCTVISKGFLSFISAVLSLFSRASLLIGIANVLHFSSHVSLLSFPNTSVLPQLFSPFVILFFHKLL